MPDPILQVIKSPNINSVSLVARRGIYQSAFSTKEIREISKLANTKMYLFKDELLKSRNEGEFY